MATYTWTEDSALYQVKNGEPGSERTESAFRYLENYAGWQPDHIVRGIAHDLLDALRELRAREIQPAAHKHQPLVADNVTGTERNHPDGYVYCGACLAPLPETPAQEG